LRRSESTHALSAGRGTLLNCVTRLKRRGSAHAYGVVSLGFDSELPLLILGSVFTPVTVGNILSGLRRFSSQWLLETRVLGRKPVRDREGPREQTGNASSSPMTV
jgi:hypothetical protein